MFFNVYARIVSATAIATVPAAATVVVAIVAEPLKNKSIDTHTNTDTHTETDRQTDPQSVTRMYALPCYMRRDIRTLGQGDGLYTSEYRC